jgi:hypothetical protein
MRLPKSVLAAALCGGLFLAASDASAQRLDGVFVVLGDNEPQEDVAFVSLLGTEFVVDGRLEGVGTDGDDVEIDYFTDTPTRIDVDDEQGRVQQNRFSTLQILIDSDVPERNLNLLIRPEKCSIDAKVNVPKAKGSVTVSCSGDDIFAGVSASQLASIQAAFANAKNVKIKVNSDGSKGSLVIKLKGPISEPA